MAYNSGCAFILAHCSKSIEVLHFLWNIKLFFHSASLYYFILMSNHTVCKDLAEVYIYRKWVLVCYHFTVSTQSFGNEDLPFLLYYCSILKQAISLSIIWFCWITDLSVNAILQLKMKRFSFVWPYAHLSKLDFISFAFHLYSHLSKSVVKKGSRSVATQYFLNQPKSLYPGQSLLGRFSN